MCIIHSHLLSNRVFTQCKFFYGSMAKFTSWTFHSHSLYLFLGFQSSPWLWVQCLLLVPFRVAYAKGRGGCVCVRSLSHPGSMQCWITGRVHCCAAFELVSRSSSNSMSPYCSDTMPLQISTIDMRSYEQTVWLVLVKGAIHSSIETNGSAVAVVLWYLFCVVVYCYFWSWVISQFIHMVL